MLPPQSSAIVCREGRFRAGQKGIIISWPASRSRLPETGSSTFMNGDNTPDTVAGDADRPISPLTIRGAQAILVHLTKVNVGCR